MKRKELIEWLQVMGDDDTEVFLIVAGDVHELNDVELVRNAIDLVSR